MKTFDQIKEKLMNMQDAKNVVQPYILKKGGFQCYHIERQVGTKRYMYWTSENYIELRKLDEHKQGWILLKRIYADKVEIFNKQ